MTGFAAALATLTGATCAAFPEIELAVVVSSGTVIDAQRRGLAKDACDRGFDYLLFLDSDMRFPMDTIARMLDHKLPIVAANYTTRRAPAEPVTYRSISTGEKLWTLPESTGLEECSATGLGVTLIHTSVFKAMPKPWFYVPYLKEIDGTWGEDIWFFNEARKAGFPVFIDHDLSKEVYHIGLREFDYLDAYAMRDTVKAMHKKSVSRKERMATNGA